jgi:PmbA protein
MPDTRFSYTPDRFREIVREALALARSRGASAAETEVSESIGQSVTVRQGEVETIEYTRDKGLSLTVYIGQQRGHASTTDLSAQAIRDTID